MTSTIHKILNPNQSEHINSPHSQGIVSPTSAPAHLLHRDSNPNTSPLSTLAQPSGLSMISQKSPLERLNSAYFSKYTSPPTSDSQQGPMILPVNSRQNSLDAYLDMSLLSGTTASGMISEIGSDTEVVFEKLWHWPSTGSGLTPGGALGTAPAGEGGTAQGGNDARGSVYARGNFDMNPNFQGFR